MQYFITMEEPSAVWISSNLLDDKIDSNLMHAKFINYLDKNYIKLRGKVRVIPNRELIEELTDFTANGSFESLNKNVEYTETKGVPFIRIKNMSENGLVMDDIKFITDNTYEYLKKSKLEGNEVLFSKTGANLGLAMVFPENFGKASLADNTFKVIYKDGYDKHYLVSFLNSKYGKLWVERLSQGSAQPTIIKESFRQIKIPIPSPEIQKYIGDKVRKAEELREEAKRLKKDAEEIFNKNYQQVIKKNTKHEWVKEHYLSEDNVIPNFYKQYDLLEDKNHVYLEFEKIVESIKCGVPVRSDMRLGSTYPFYGASGITDSMDEYNFDGEYLIVAQDGSVGCVNVARNKFWANNHVWIVKIKDEWDVEFLELYMQKYSYWNSLTTGSVVPKVTAENLKRLLVPKIEYTIQDKIGELIRESKSKQQESGILIKQAKQDIEDLIEGNFDMSKVNETN